MSSRGMIIFSKDPRAGEVKTRLGGTIGMQAAARLYDEFAQHAFSLGEEFLHQGVDVSLYYTGNGNEEDFRSWVGRPFRFEPQSGASLGEKMHRAFDQAFVRGTDRAIIIGTDVPELTVDIIQCAWSALERRDIVIGPSTDGGYYLLGMHAPVKRLFDDIVWSSHTVFDETVRRVEGLGLSCEILATLADIDTEEDLRQYHLRRTKT